MGLERQDREPEEGQGAEVGRRVLLQRMCPVVVRSGVSSKNEGPMKGECAAATRESRRELLKQRRGLNS